MGAGSSCGFFYCVGWIKFYHYGLAACFCVVLVGLGPASFWFFSLLVPVLFVKFFFFILCLVCWVDRPFYWFLLVVSFFSLLCRFVFC